MKERKKSKLLYVQEEFNKHNTITLSELNKTLENVFTDMDKKDLRHNIRSIINTMRQQGKIKRVGHGIWEKI